MKRAVIILTRLPLVGETKSRLKDFLPADKIQALSKRLLEKNFAAVQAVEADVIFWVTSREKGHSLAEFLELTTEAVYEQGDGDLGERMQEAIQHALDEGYDQVILVGSDLADLTADLLTDAFDALQVHEAVITPTADGGYGLIGMKAIQPSLFQVKQYGGQTVYQEVVQQAKKVGLDLESVGNLHDIDTKEDLVRLITQDPSARFLAQGEYNANFVFGEGKKIFRLALGSQMHLENQIAYEYLALKLLEPSGVTPRAEGLFHDGDFLDLDYLVESFLPGRPLVYEKDATLAATLLAKIHQVVYPADHGLIEANHPFKLMLEEFLTMFRTYQNWPKRDARVQERIEHLLDQLRQYDLEAPLEHPCIINTELNASNFLMNEDGPSYVIDWEKPLIGEREQDLAHFLAPTTTLWKTSFRFDPKGIASFVADYNAVSPIPVNENKLQQYLKFTCLRGLTWCAMAYVQYQEASKVSRNDQTYRVIASYLTDEFLTMIESYFNEDGVSVGKGVHK